MQEISEELAYLLRTKIVAHVSLTEVDGSLVTHVMWVDYDGEHILTSSPTQSYRRRPLLELSLAGVFGRDRSV